ncbi:MAG TPA: glycosyltransferase family 39 protein [Tepidisphaeraceae bacterium]|nr:glycosyltransferase family 39 protein [Tepidisphaeraceae bacterium]
MTSLRAAAIVFVVSLAAYCFMLGDAPLAGTEGHRALTAHQMVQSGHWLLPRLYGQLYLKKPPLAYWMIALSETIFGRANEWVWRFPSAFFSAVLAAALCLFSDNWFGRPAGIVAGFANLALVATWAQNRSADIDAMNSAAAVLAACGLIHLQAGPVKHRALTIILTGLAVGAALMIKGPEGMTVIGGAIFAPWIVQRKWNWVSLVPLAIGLCCFGAYAAAAYHQIRAEHLPLDLSGFAEAEQKATPSVSRLLWMVMLTPTLFVFALPVSLVIPFAWNDRRPRARCLLYCVALAVIFAFCSGMTNPRYAYVILPMLCPLVGAVMSEEQARKWVPAAAAMAVAGMIPFAIFNNRQLERKSGHDAGEIMRDYVSRGTTVVCGVTLWDQPEIFYYGHVNVEYGLEHATGGDWLVLKGQENNLYAGAAGRDYGKPIVLWAGPDKDICLIRKKRSADGNARGSSRP